MTPITKTCRVSGKTFLIDDYDQAFYAKMQVPLPTLCPDERQRLRLSFRNERTLYHRKCDLCEKQIISMYSADSPYVVYCNSCWWGDKWDAKIFGKAFDFSRPFFEQLKELQLKVPRLALVQKNSENCDYTNHAENNRNCYLCVDSSYCENVYYSKWMIQNKDCADSYNIEKSELCYECQYVVGGYHSFYNFLSDNNSNSAFLYNCYNCSDSFMCNGLIRKSYCVYNKQLTKEEYEAFMKTVNLGSYAQLRHFVDEYENMIQKSPKQSVILISENCTGDCIYQSKNVFDSFDVIYSQDCRYCYETGYAKDCFDTYESAFACELQYNCHGCNRSVNIQFGNVSYDVSDSLYVDLCQSSKNLFACVGVHRSEYCILNTEYSKEEFETLKAQIIDQMKKTGEWGEFFPATLSPFAYNETLAQEYFPLTAEEAKARGYNWIDEKPEDNYQGAFITIPDSIQDVPEDFSKQILKCEVSGKLYKIIPQELTLYKSLGLALPRRAPQQRYLDRLKLRNPRRLWDRNCIHCKQGIRVPFEKDEQVYCNHCYTQLFHS
ncbi:hypothetical protein IPG41_05875 [Candidatus Peregrinibacteria bacterium]|nr:MAG: hypothetical protein IPG41_05875 [Candidatus Peregrinibacteria bacterium]